MEDHKCFNNSMTSTVMLQDDSFFSKESVIKDKFLTETEATILGRLTKLQLELLNLQTLNFVMNQLINLLNEPNKIENNLYAKSHS